MHQSQHSQHQHSQVSDTLTKWALTGAILGAGVILAPHVLPAIGIGSVEAAGDSMFMLHESSGLAGGINSLLAGVPLVGAKLAEGGLFNAAMTGVIGIGGVMLGNFIEKREDGSNGFNWGKAVKYAALATSAIIALPTVLTAISCGLIFLATLSANPMAAPETVGLVTNTLGAVGMSGAMMGMSGIAAAIPHFFTCGMSMLPTALSMTVLKSKAHKAGDELAIEFKPDSPLEAGKPCTAEVRIKDVRTGDYLTADELATTHTEKLHLMVVDSSLQDYHHLHPQPSGKKDVFIAKFTPQTGNGYGAWADFNTAKDGQNHRLYADIPCKSRRNMPARITQSHEASAGGLSCSWQANSPLKQGQDTLVHVQVRDSAGNPVTDLEPIMGAYAHLVGFSADGHSMIHCHPVGAEPQAADDRGGPQLSFHVTPESAGQTQFYLQLRRNGQDITLPFGQMIAPPSLYAQKTQHTGHEHAHVHR